MGKGPQEVAGKRASSRSAHRLSVPDGWLAPATNGISDTAAVMMDCNQALTAVHFGFPRHLTGTWNL